MAKLVVRRFLRNNHIMWMTFDQTRVGDTSKASPCAKVIERGRARVAHAGAQAADQLVYVFAQRALVRYTAFDAFRNEFAASVLTRGVAVHTIAFHRGQASHPAIFLEAAALIEHDFTRRFIQPRQHTPQHDRVTTHHDRLDDVAAELDAAIRNDRYSILSGDLRTLKNRRDLRHART